MEQSQLYFKITALPSNLKSEVIDFIDFLMKKRKKEVGNKKPKFGCAKGEIFISPDFDEPLDDFKEYK